MKIKQLVPAAAIVLLSTIGSASAAPITFEFESATSGTHLVTSPSMTQMGTTVTMTGSGDLYNTRQGVGVGTDAYTSTGESVSFTFTPNAVSLLSGIVFESAKSMSGSDFRILGDGVELTNISFINEFITSGGTFLTSLNFDNWTATTFEFAGMSDNGFRVKSLTVEVPEPGMVALMGIGLLMAGVATRRRRKS